MKRWDSNRNEQVEDLRIDAFLADLVAVCRKHDLSLSHEDGHGSFLVRLGFDEFFAKWLSEAAIDRVSP